MWSVCCQFGGVVIRCGVIYTVAEYDGNTEETHDNLQSDRDSTWERPEQYSDDLPPELTCSVSAMSSNISKRNQITHKTSPPDWSTGTVEKPGESPSHEGDNP
jgi:hypothetical protein